jgi:gas vesicle protein
MASEPTRTAEELTSAIRSFVDKALESQTREEIARRGRELAATIAETAGTAAERASEAATEAWQDSAGQRREAAKQAQKMSRDAVRWGRRTWKKQVAPTLRSAWKSRIAALSAAGVTVPASKEIVDQARQRLGMQKREPRHWGTFLLGLLLGAIGGAIVALLTAPRPGREMRDELATRAREAATNAGEWVPLFQRSEVEPETGATEALEGVPPVTDVQTPAPRQRRSSKGNGADTDVPVTGEGALET